MVVAPLVERLVVQDAMIAELGRTIERQADQLVMQAETIGRQGAELEVERERGKSFHVELDQARTERDAAETSRRHEHRRLRIGLAVAGALAIAATLWPVWVR